MTDPTPCDIHGRLMLSPAEGGEPVCDFCVVVAAERKRAWKIVDRIGVDLDFEQAAGMIRRGEDADTIRKEPE